MKLQRSFFNEMDKIINDLVVAEPRLITADKAYIPDDGLWRKTIALDKPERILSNNFTSMLIHIVNHMDPPCAFTIHGIAHDKKYHIDMAADDQKSLQVSPELKARLLVALEEYKHFLLNPAMFSAKSVKTKRNGTLTAYVVNGEADDDVSIEDDPEGADALEREEFIKAICHFHRIQPHYERIVTGDEIAEEFYILPADMKRIFENEGMDYSLMPLAGLGV